MICHVNCKRFPKVRYIPQKILAKVTSEEPTREIVEPLQKPKKGPRMKDIIANYHLLFAILAVYPSRVPVIDTICKALELLDDHYKGWILQCSEEHRDGLLRALGLLIKRLVGKVRRMFRRSSNSRNSKVRSLKALVVHVKKGNKADTLDDIWLAVLDEEDVLSISSTDGEVDQDLWIKT